MTTQTKTFHLVAVEESHCWNHLPDHCTAVYGVYLVCPEEGPPIEADFLHNVFDGLDPNHPFVEDHYAEGDHTAFTALPKLHSAPFEAEDWEEACEHAWANPPDIPGLTTSWPVYYAVQYRDMHTAVHHVALFANLEGARAYLAYLTEHEQHPGYPDPEFVADIEIDFRCRPERHDGVLLEYVNDRRVPDAW